MVLIARRATAAFLLASLVACGGGPDGPGSSTATPCEETTPLEDLARLPEDLPFEDWGTITYLRRKKGFAVVRLVSDTTVVELHPKIARAILDAGYEIVGADNEGFESEIFFKPQGKETGYFQLREGPCDGQVTTSMIFGRR